MRNYELIYILKPNLEEDVKEAVLAKVQAIVEEGKAEISRKEMLKLMKKWIEFRKKKILKIMKNMKK